VVSRYRRNNSVFVVSRFQKNHKIFQGDKQIHTRMVLATVNGSGQVHATTVLLEGAGDICCKRLAKRMLGVGRSTTGKLYRSIAQHAPERHASRQNKPEMT